jgi:Ca-activated chloride channel family protein
MREPGKRLHWMVTIFLGALLLPGWAAAGPANVELIIDASGSMAARMEGRSKMDIAKEVLAGLLADLPADAQVAVRAYGHRRKNDCNDIELLAPLGPRGSIPVEGRVNALKPVGMTPIAGSLEAAGKDFTGREGQRNVIILVSDGQETCKGDPCAVARNLRQAGVQVEVNVIGFDVKADERKQLECIAEGGGGRYYNAANAKEFQVAAAEVKQQVAAAPPASPAGGGAFRDDFEGSKLTPPGRS